MSKYFQNRGRVAPRATDWSAPNRRRFLGLSGIAAGMLAAPRIASAQAYPVRPVHAVVTFAPGGTVDVYARLACQHLSQKLGQQFVVENVTGATGNRGTAQVARSEPDGYTILFALSTHAVNASVFNNLPYDPVADFVPINLSVASTHVISVHPSVTANNARELVADLKARPNSELRAWGRRNPGTPSCRTSQADAEARHGRSAVFRRGAGYSVRRLQSCSLAWTTVASAGPMISGGQLKALAVTGKGDRNCCPTSRP